jgi:flagellar biogenesis protein FliO
MTGWFAPPRQRRLELLDRVALTHQHSVHLLSVEGRWLAVAVTAKGVELLESGPLQSGSFQPELAAAVRKGGI